MPRPSGNLAAHHADQLRIPALRIHRHITDPLSRQGKGFRKGIAGERVIVKRGRIRRIHTRKDNLPVRLVRNQENVVSVLLLFLLHDPCKLLHGLLGVNHARRIVGRVNQNCHHLLRQHLLKRLKIDLKIFGIRRHHLENRSRQIHIGRILREKGCKGENLVPRLRHAPQRMGNGACRAGGHKDMIARVMHPESLVEGGCHLIPDGRNPETLAVPMQFHRVLLLQHLYHCVRKCLGHRHGRVSKAEIKHILIADLLPPCHRKLRELPDHRFSL